MKTYDKYISPETKKISLMIEWLKTIPLRVKVTNLKVLLFQIYLPDINVVEVSEVVVFDLL